MNKNILLIIFVCLNVQYRAYSSEELTADDKLIVAVIKNDLAGAQAAIDAGATGSCLDKNGKSPIIAAAAAGSIALLDLLLKHGADINHQSRNSHSTALIVACKEGHLKAVRFLLKNGAQTNIQTNNGQTALILASLYGHEKIVLKLLKAGAHVDIQDDQGNTAIMCAAYKNYPKIVARLLLKGASTEIKNKNGLGIKIGLM